MVALLVIPVTRRSKQNLISGLGAFISVWATTLRDAKPLRVVSENTDYLEKCQNKRLRTLKTFLHTEIQELKRAICEINICVYKAQIFSKHRQETDKKIADGCCA